MQCKKRIKLASLKSSLCAQANRFAERCGMCKCPICGYALHCVQGKTAPVFICGCSGKKAA